MPGIPVSKLALVLPLFIAMLFLQPAAAQSNGAFDSALQKAQALPNDSLRLRELNRINDAYPSLTSRQVVRLGTLMLSAATALKSDTNLVRIHYMLADSYMRLTQYPNALNHYLLQLNAAQRLKNYKQQVNAYQGMSWIYKTTGEAYNSPTDLAKAVENLNKALAVTREQHLEKEEAVVLDGLAIQYDIAKQHNLAITTFKQSLAIKQRLKLGRSEMISHMNMGISYKKNREFDSALAEYQKAAAITDSFKLVNERSYLMDNLAYLYFEMNDLAQSEKYAVGAAKMAKDLGERALSIDVYELLTKLYAKQNKYEDAYKASAELMSLKDSVFNQDKSAQLKDLQEKYETDIKDKQITNQQSQIDYNKKLNVTLAIGGACAVLIALVIYFNLRKTARLNRLVSAQRDELDKQSKSLSLMMKELHHRVKNNLQIVSSLLNLQSLRLTDDGAISAVQESKQRVQAMSLIHQRLYKTEDITRINMKEYINELAGFLSMSYGYGPDNFTLQLDIQEEWTDIDKALPLGLILNELLTNAFKYAFKGIAHPALYISFKHAADNIELVVKDNGNGIKPGEWDAGRNTSFGRQLIKSLCGQLRAKEKLEVDEGTRFTYTIPAAA